MDKKQELQNNLIKSVNLCNINLILNFIFFYLISYESPVSHQLAIK